MSKKQKNKTENTETLESVQTDTETPETFDVTENAEDAENVIDAEIISEAEDTNLSYELDADTFANPHQKLFDDFELSDFREQLNKSEQKLLTAVINGTKLVVDLGISDSRMWNAITDKHSQFTSGLDENGQEPVENFRKYTETENTDEPAPENTSTALAKSEAIEPEVVGEDTILPLSEEEKAKKAELENIIQTTKDGLDEALERVEKLPFVMMQALSEVRELNLFRDEAKSLAEYAEKKFGITPKYAFALAQGGDFRKVLLGIGGNVPEMVGSVRATQQFLRQANTIAEDLGLDESQFAEMEPIIKEFASVVSGLVTEKDGTVSPVASRVFAATGDVIREVVNSGTVTIDGEQMSIEKAKELGLVDLAVKSEIVAQVAEGLHTQNQNIIDMVKRKEASRTKPHEPSETPRTDSKEYHKGKIPKYDISCDYHPKYQESFSQPNTIVNVFNAGFELACGCKFQKLINSGDEFVCIEVKGKAIKY